MGSILSPAVMDSVGPGLIGRDPVYLGWRGICVHAGLQTDHIWGEFL